MKPYILVVDDEPDIRGLVKDILEDEGYQVDVAANGESARQLVKARQPDLVLLDIWMPDTDGISLLKEFSEVGMTSPVVMISGHGTVESAVEATRLGAFDFIEKPLSLGKLLLTVQRALTSGGKEKEFGMPRRQALQYPVEPVGKSVQIRNFRDQIKRVAGYETPVLIVGEAGSGKSLFARYLHDNSARSEGPFVSVRVAHIDENIDMVLFGSDNLGEVMQGYLEQAHRGTLFLNDIADLDLPTQGKLLDVLITRSFKRIGGKERKEIDVRIVAGTKYDLMELVKSDRFRDDLYFRLGEITLPVPPLRDYREDVPELLGYFVDFFVSQEGLPYRKFNVASQNWLRNYHWPGNVLELRNLVHRLLILGDGNEIGVAEVENQVSVQSQLQLQVASSPDDFSLPLREARDRFEKSYLEYHLRQARGNVGLVARQAGMERTHLYRKFRQLGIDPKKIG